MADAFQTVHLEAEVAPADAITETWGTSSLVSELYLVVTDGRPQTSVVQTTAGLSVAKLGEAFPLHNELFRIC